MMPLGMVEIGESGVIGKITGQDDGRKSDGRQQNGRQSDLRCQG